MAEHSPNRLAVGQLRPRSLPSGDFWEAMIHVCDESGLSLGNVIAVVHMGGKAGTDASKEAVLANAERFVGSWNFARNIEGGRPGELRKADAINALLEALLAYEKWEAKLLVCNDAWKDRTYPELNEPLFDELLRIQALRNEAVKKAREA